MFLTPEMIKEEEKKSTLRAYKSARIEPHPSLLKLNWTMEEPNNTNFGLTGPTISLSLSTTLSLSQTLHKQRELLEKHSHSKWNLYRPGFIMASRAYGHFAILFGGVVGI